MSLPHFTLRIEVPPIDIRVHSAPDHEILSALKSLKETIMTSNADLTAQLNAAADKADKSKAEVVAAVGALKTEVEDLKAKIAAGGADVPPEVVAAADRVSAAVDAIDQLNPDA
jgi:uncharacterized protein YqfA (UPF0365 family)